MTQSTDKLQAQRFELKYLINEDVAQGMRDFVRSHLVLDEYSARQPSLAYAIHSLYLDSSELSHYWDVINANKNRVKMRIRYYDDHPDANGNIPLSSRGGGEDCLETIAVQKVVD